VTVSNELTFSSNWNFKGKKYFRGMQERYASYFLFLKEIVAFDAFHAVEDIFTGAFKIIFQIIEQIPDVFAFGMPVRGASLIERQEFPLSAVFFQEIFFDIQERTDDAIFAAEYREIGDHRADFAIENHIQKQCFGDVIFMVPESDFCTAEFLCRLEDIPSPDAGAEKTGIFTILAAVSVGTDICTHNLARHPHIFEKALYLLTPLVPIPVKSHVDINGGQLQIFTVDGDPQLQQVEQGDRVRTA
jgi:hypothetical protein